MNSLFSEDQRSKVFGHVIRVAIGSASRLPAHEMALRIFAETIDAIEITAPSCARLDRMRADGFQRDLGGGVPHVIFFVDAALALPAGIPVGFVFFLSEIDGEIDPVAGGCDFEFAVVLDVSEIVAEEKFDDV